MNGAMMGFQPGIPQGPDLRMLSVLHTEFLQREILWLGSLCDGTNWRLRYRAPLMVPWVQEHIQTDQPGEGGADYDSTAFLSSVEVDCREDRMRDITIAITPGVIYYVYLVPIQEDGEGNRILYDGEGGRADRMSFNWFDTYMEWIKLP